MRLPDATPPVPTELSFDVVISQTVGLPAHGTSIRTRPTGGSEWQMVLLAEALAERGLSVAIVGPYGAHAMMHGVRYIPAHDVEGIVDTFSRQRPTVKVTADVVISERFGEIAGGLEFNRVVFDLHDLPDQRLAGVQAAMQQIDHSKIVVHSEFMRSLLPEWPRLHIIPCMIPDEFYAVKAQYQPRSHEKDRTYVYGSAAIKGLAPTLALWRQLKRDKAYNFKRASLIVTSPGYDQIDPALLEGQRDVVVQTGMTPAMMQMLLAQADGIFHAGCMPETFGIVFAQCEIAGKPAHVLRLGYDDALTTTLGGTTLHDDRDMFVAGFDGEQQKPKAKDYRISTHIGAWLDVLELKQAKAEAA